MDAEVVGSQMIDTPVGEQETYKVRTVFDRKPYPGLNNKRRPRIVVDIFFGKKPGNPPLAFHLVGGPVRAQGQLVRWSRGR